jgi:2-polyprenyl-3-methyl-5-hydroxy-6-metoxy-1,4-benzoquinol methylase
MSEPKLDRDFWEQLWSKTLREQPDKVARRPPNAHLMTRAALLAPGRALDAGCGHGAETLWLATRGWHVSAVDFSRAALDQGRSMAALAGPEVASRIDWIEADLASWTSESGKYDLVVCLYVHAADSVPALVARMANGVAPGGSLLLVGHRPLDPRTGAATPAANQVQVSVEAAVAALEPVAWELIVAEERPRAVVGSGVDAVIFARRRL